MTIGAGARAMSRPASRAAEIVRRLEALGDPKNVAGMARYGIRSAKVCGVPMPTLRAMAKAIGTDHALAAALWKTGVMDARIVAGLIADPSRVTRAQMERWVADFDSWALCDGICCNLFDRTAFAVEQIATWTARPEEYVKRAGFVLMAALASHDKALPDGLFLGFLAAVVREADDGRNFVRKGVNWALRQIGKRNASLHAAALRTCRRLVDRPEASARWIGHDATRDLTSAATLARFRTARSRLPAGARSRSRRRR